MKIIYINMDKKFALQYLASEDVKKHNGALTASYNVHAKGLCK
jgi:hypothetical protein